MLSRRLFDVGKVPPSVLRTTVYPYLGRDDPDLLSGPGIGRDSAAVRVAGKVLVLSADPITGTTRNIGAHSVYVNANDIATAGARPRWYLCTILLPPRTRESALHEMMAGVDTAARSLRVSVVGGHSETTHGLKRPIIAGFMIGEAQNKVLSSAGGRTGDVVLLTKTAGLEGTAIIASNQQQHLRGVSRELLQKARFLFRQISVVEEALAVAGLEGVHALHDPTEGGVLNALWELAESSQLGIEAWADRIPIAPETKELCSKLGLNPLKLMSSGALLIAVKGSGVERVCRALERRKIRVSRIGRLVSKADGRYLFTASQKTRLDSVSRDELYRLV